jgi:hypothetical protein
MALETAEQKNKEAAITETLSKLKEVEMKLSQLRKSKTQVTEGSCCLIYTVKMRLALQGTDCCHLLAAIPPPCPVPSSVQDLHLHVIRFYCNS